MANPHQMVLQRHLCGLIGVLLVILGVFFYARGSSNTLVAAASLRAGSLLMVTWLAWPKLIEWHDVIPRFVLTALIALAVILVARPSWGKVAGVVAAVAIGGSFARHWLKTWKQNR